VKGAEFCDELVMIGRIARKPRRVSIPIGTRPIDARFLRFRVRELCEEYRMSLEQTDAPSHRSSAPRKIHAFDFAWFNLQPQGSFEDRVHQVSSAVSTNPLLPEVA
jgi:hypothetical protein